MTKNSLALTIIYESVEGDMLNIKNLNKAEIVETELANRHYSEYCLLENSQCVNNSILNLFPKRKNETLLNIRVQ